ncbi:STAS domain-containing protein [Ancylomarina longa]|uniref:Anti-sigma factor antagonist n=1 Tax=Ancylomarina longa TaxID=2487017 RepID=A0A434AYG3_9BACT|nr:STAS domain-containing protein [Ancylomarina longa]RUT79580.1 anti-sigma factor antagonist [Ancylomarina longa]
MNIETKQIDTITIMKLGETNRLYALNANIAKEKMNEVLTQPESKLVVDFEAINFIDSSGFGALLSALKTSKEHHSKIKLCNINRDVMELIELMQLDSIFDILQDPSACINSFSSVE